MQAFTSCALRLPNECGAGGATLHDSRRPAPYGAGLFHLASPFGRSTTPLPRLLRAALANPINGPSARSTRFRTRNRPARPGERGPAGRSWDTECRCASALPGRLLPAPRAAYVDAATGTRRPRIAARNPAPSRDAAGSSPRMCNGREKSLRGKGVGQRPGA